MEARGITRLIDAHEVTEGAGVTVHRTLGTPALRNLDPFLLLDHFSSDDPDDYIAGFPDHPHRGFITLTYMLDGHMLHRDSMGSEGDLRTGGAQWMKAASGVIHSEMPRQVEGLMRGFQLWINLPAARKMDAPAYQDIAPEAIPVHDAPGVRVHVLAGTHAGVRGPIDDPVTHLQYLDVELAPGTPFLHKGTTDADHNAFVYVFEGDTAIAGQAVPRHHLAVLGPGERLEVTAGGDGARLILVSGRPIGEPIVQYGPFVMNTREEIEQALADYRDGRLVRGE
ncbi:MAG: pirin family protein [Gammaproteobacteria bacterium]|nr:pirin family protein [Gammaproteobacteria bacterium]